MFIAASLHHSVAVETARIPSRMSSARHENALGNG